MRCEHERADIVGWI